MPQSSVSLPVHLVFSTKHRESLITDDLKVRLFEYFAWQSGYGAFAVSHSNRPDVILYIANQTEHHRVRSFQEEFIALLVKHEIECDERYLWE